MNYQISTTASKEWRNSIEGKEFETKITEIIQRSYDVKSFRLAVPDDMEFKPGRHPSACSGNGQEHDIHRRLTDKGMDKFSEDWNSLVK